MVLQCLIKSGGIPSLHGALPEAKLSMALLSSSTNGSESNSSMVSRQSMTSRAALFSEMPVSIVRTFQVPSFRAGLFSSFRAGLFSFFLLLPGALVAGCFSVGS